jgi:hypothetical protein
MPLEDELGLNGRVHLFEQEEYSVGLSKGDFAKTKNTYGSADFGGTTRRVG